MIVPDRAEYEESDSSLAKYTIASKSHEIKQLEKELRQLKTNRDEAIDLIVRDYYSKTTIDINSIGYTTNKFLKIKEILERGKE